ncbi:hypothetical protein MTY66_31610 [Mycolicibacterium sp. TY66]|jgi:hypothetical protein|uniref:Uncharacterized protein n=1 Tax=Mycolicibacterium mucogenicum TaxID=56689 RepID=A0A1A0MUT7_MYCMU|nr:hypothetical protein A5642_15250 [Mycolicibacterium mucogenicum]BCI81536.1 hypothetical protein MTY66_31610 [Mycolicibacterium sp. TY66]BCJ80809.1 hypothetical protein MTY81_21820 [Mycolicibacterium sp. TY81]
MRSGRYGQHAWLWLGAIAILGVAELVTIVDSRDCTSSAVSPSKGPTTATIRLPDQDLSKGVERYTPVTLPHQRFRIDINMRLPAIMVATGPKLPQTRKLPASDGHFDIIELHLRRYAALGKSPRLLRRVDGMMAPWPS